jgi:hypothetical protein
LKSEIKSLQKELKGLKEVNLSEHSAITATKIMANHQIEIVPGQHAIIATKSDVCVIAKPNYPHRVEDGLLVTNLQNFIANVAKSREVK